MQLNEPAKVMVALGIFFILAGVLWNFLGPILPLGKLWGDFRLEKENFSFYFPLASSIILSLIISGALWLFRYFTKQ